MPGMPATIYHRQHAVGGGRERARFRLSRRGVKLIEPKVWLVSFMQYDLRFFDRETDRATSAENSFGAKMFLVRMNN
jgi:hypothetical protein